MLRWSITDLPVLMSFFVLILQIPHFGLGLGIGVLDAALVPYLSSRIDSKYGHSSSGGGGCYSDCSSNDAFPSNYGTVYAIQQMAVSLAYSASPLLATSIFVSFPTLMFFIGLLNIIYAFVFYYFTVGAGQKTVRQNCISDFYPNELLLLNS